MIPREVMSTNIGSQKGLGLFLKWLQSLPSPKSYRFVLCDINIYWRTTLWLYNDVSFQSNLKQRHVFILGFWHPYKELCLKLWNAYY